MLYLSFKLNNVKPFLTNRETANIGLVSSVVERRHVSPEVAGSDPALVNFSLFIQNYLKICTQSVSLVVYYMIFTEKKLYPFMVHPLTLPRLYHNLGVILAKGQYMVEWLLTGAPPPQRYWQNRETANIGLVSSVGRAPAFHSFIHSFIHFLLKNQLAALSWIMWYYKINITVKNIKSIKVATPKLQA